MEPEEFKQAWQASTSQRRLSIDADLLFQEVRRNQERFDTMIFWRDVRSGDRAAADSNLIAWAEADDA